MEEENNIHSKVRQPAAGDTMREKIGVCTHIPTNETGAKLIVSRY